ncbi:hypothetical protein AVEN_170698-1 [Araneus ventricosus]|uniref:Uncharacterized protein n=1 Tax=Araneus ventricosus TaxID=182803 RepID=A0A4Y2W6S9_ARAVE|nr:hypothetical protein AVEN_170698-1 [Araneus ventricosus]
MMESGSAPQCVEDYKLKDFECTGGEDEEKDKEMHEKFREHYSSLSDEDKEGVQVEISFYFINKIFEPLNFLRDFSEAVMAEVELSEECKEKVKKIQSKMTGE